MPILKQITTILTGLFLCFNSYSQTDSCELKISLLTCGPGEDLYSVFGHSALRVTHAGTNTDIIYNYGTFDFSDPDFYVKFVRGKLLYYVSTEKTEDFMYAYQVENRWVMEQDLQLTCREKNSLYQALRTNALEQNKYYLYEFLFDNCSTRLRDIVKNNADDSVHVKRIISEPAPTFRNMLHDYLLAGGQRWSMFGIDLLLGSRIDRKVQNQEAMFLPDYLMKGFDSSVIRHTPLVGSKKIILPASEKDSNGFAITPLIVTSILLIAGVLLTAFRSPRLAKVSGIFDSIFFFILGLMGCLMLFMWYGTDHELCRNNYNLYWALPTHIIAAFFIRSNRPLTRKYFTISAILAVVFILSWPFLPQGMNQAFFPLVLLAAVRGLDRARIKK